MKALGWLKPHPEQKGVLVVRPVALGAIAAFEKQIEPYLAHPIFSKFGEVSVTNAEVGKWAAAWALESPTNAEKEAMIKTLGGEYANQQRRDGVGLVAAAVSYLGGVTDLPAVRRTMCGLPTGFAPSGPLESAARAWRIVQVRQMFRLGARRSVLLDLAEAGRWTGEYPGSGGCVSGFSWKLQHGRNVALGSK